MEGTNPMLTSKLHVLLNILATCWWIFMRLQYRNSFDEDYHKSLVSGKTFCIILCFLHSIFTHTCTYTYIYTCMYVCLCVSQLSICSQMQSWNQCGCYILAHLSAIWIPSAIDIWILKGVMRYIIFWINQFKWKIIPIKGKDFQVFGLSDRFSVIMSAVP